jgi:hypothetical protein
MCGDHFRSAQRMKAEHRKELQTNVLADRMGKLVESLKNPPSTSSVVFWVIAGLAVVTVVAWFWFSRPSETGAMLWARLDSETFNRPPDYYSEGRESEVVKNLSDIAKAQPRSVASRTARFQEARFLLPMGLKSLVSPFRTEAHRQLQQARDLFADLAKESGDNPMLMQEAFLGAGKAEEALIGVIDKDSGKSVGDIDRAKEFYRKARDLNAETYLGKTAARHLELLEKDPTQVVKFYTDLNKRDPEPKKEPPFSLPGGPGFPRAPR